jgi:hypothetical protein
VGLSILAVATELGISRDTIDRKLAANGWKGGALRWRDVVRALVGDKSAALARKALADAELAEHEVRVATRDVMPREEVAKWIRETFAPVREQAVAMPAVMSSRCNPTDPRHAQVQLEEWVENFLRHVRERCGEETEEKE